MSTAASGMWLTFHWWWPPLVAMSSRHPLSTSSLLLCLLSLLTFSISIHAFSPPSMLRGLQASASTSTALLSSGHSPAPLHGRPSLLSGTLSFYRSLSACISRPRDLISDFSPFLSIFRIHDPAQQVTKCTRMDKSGFHEGSRTEWTEGHKISGFSLGSQGSRKALIRTCG